MGGFESLFGGGYSAPDVPEVSTAPIREEEKEPVSAAVRDEERRRLRSRRSMGGTILTSPLGSTGGSGSSGSGKTNMGILGHNSQ